MLAGSIVTKVDRVMDVSFTVRWSDRKQLVSQSMSWLRCLSTSSWHPRIGHVTGSLGLLAGNSCILNNRRKMIIINVRNAMVMPITTILFEVGYCVHTQRHITLSLELKSVLNLNLSLSHSPSLSLCMTHAHTHTHTMSFEMRTLNLRILPWRDTFQQNLVQSLVFRVQDNALSENNNLGRVAT